MIKEFNDKKEIEKYYNKETNTYVFIENEEYIDLVVFNFDVNVKAHINAYDIKARDIRALNIDAGDIDAHDIKAWDVKACDIEACDIKALNIDACDIKARDINASDIKALNINARNISYYAVCIAYENIKCKSIKGERENHKHFVLDGILQITEEEEDKYEKD